eukprot:1101718-Pelagomonas_calceolata.AAC.1
MAVLDVQFMELPGWSCAASSFFITSHTAEYPMARSDQNSIGAAGVVSSLIRNVWVKELWSDVQIMLGQTVCAAYIHIPQCVRCQGIGNLRECGQHYPYDDILRENSC